MYQTFFPVTHRSLGAQRTEVMLVKISEKSRHWLAWTLTVQAVGWLVGSWYEWEVVSGGAAPRVNGRTWGMAKSVRGRGVLPEMADK